MSLAGAVAASNYDATHYGLTSNAVADSGYYSGGGGARITMASAQNTGVAGSAETVARGNATATLGRSLADCAIDLVGSANSSVFADGITHAGTMTVDGVLLNVGTVSSSAGSAADAASSFFTK